MCRLDIASKVRKFGTDDLICDQWLPERLSPKCVCICIFDANSRIRDLLSEECGRVGFSSDAFNDFDSFEVAIQDSDPKTEFAVALLGAGDDV